MLKNKIKNILVRKLKMKQLYTYYNSNLFFLEKKI